MNILIFAGFPLQNAGGVGRVSLTLAREFKKKGHSVVFLAAQIGKQQVVEGTRQLFLPSSNIRSKKNKTYLESLVKRENIDAIINQAGAAPLLADLVLSARDICAILTVHHNCVLCLIQMHRSIIDHTLDRHRIPLIFRTKMGYKFLQARSKKRIGKCFERLAAQGARLVMLSPTFIPELESFSDRINLNKVVAIPNPAPFPSDRSALQAKEKRLLFVGRLANQQKRVDRVLLIWKRIANDFPDWQLDILGDGPDRRQLENRSREMSLERIVFHGSQDPVPFYRRSQFLLLTSDFEGFGMVLVEAQAFGCIPIATNCFSAISDVIDDGRTGFITPVDNMDLFTRTLSLAISSPKKARIMGEAAVSHVAKFSSSRTAERWLSELKKVVGPTR